MTTIAYVRGVIAFDSRITKDTLIVSDDFNKYRKRKGVHFVMAGTYAEFERLIRSYQLGRAVKGLGEIEALIFDSNDGNLYTAGCNSDGEFYVEQESLNEPIALGSGQHHAITAMDIGESAEAAVGWAIKRDNQSGGRIRTLEIATLKEDRK